VRLLLAAYPGDMAPIDRKATLALEEDIIRLGEAAHDPELSKEEAEAGIQEFDTFLERFEG
jgi:hypothetical protein